MEYISDVIQCFLLAYDAEASIIVAYFIEFSQYLLKF